MAKRTALAELAVNVEANAFAALMDGGFIDLYDGVPPDTADTPISRQRLGVTLGFGTPAFGRAAAGVIIANPITSGVAKASLDPATWARVYKSDHRTPVMDVSVGVDDAVITLPTVTIPAGVTVTCSFFSHAVARAAG